LPGYSGPDDPKDRVQVVLRGQRRLHGGSDAQLDDTHLMRMAGRFARRVEAWATSEQARSGFRYGCSVYLAEYSRNLLDIPLLRAIFGLSCGATAAWTTSARSSPGWPGSPPVRHRLGLR
jgi:hypothetical protein